MRSAWGGDLQTIDSLAVGANVRGGTGSGQVIVGGDLRMTSSSIDFPFARVGVGVGSFVFFGEPGIGDPATGSLSVTEDLTFVPPPNGGHAASELNVGVASSRTRADGRVDIGGDVLGFWIVDVGVSNRSGDGEAIAVGELHVAGKLDLTYRLRPDGPDDLAFLSVGVNRSAGSEPSLAQGYATIGEIEARQLEVGLSQSFTGPASGVLEIGSGDAFSATVGEARGNADASGTFQTGGGLLYRAGVGVSEGGGVQTPQGFIPFITGRAVGSMTADGSVGSASVGLLGSDGSATGTLEVEGVRDAGSGVGGVFVGFNYQGAGTADGRMLVRSGGIDADSIVVGATLGQGSPARPRLANGTVTGVLESTGDVTSLSNWAGADVVGYGNTRSGGHADGTLILHEGTFTSRKLIVGQTLGTGTATGRLHLDRTLVDTGDLTLGDGATVEIDVLGLLRGTEYSAIDAGVARLDGDLAVAFLAPAQLGVYDLIISNALDGIAGGFDSVSIAGLAADQHAFWGIETAAIGGAPPVEVFRLYVVPEPASAALLALGLLALAAARRRR